MFWNVPAQASLWVRKSEVRLNSFFMVAGIEECSNSDVGAGPCGLLTTAEATGPASSIRNRAKDVNRG